MKGIPAHLAYSQTGFFSATVLDYISGATELQPFYIHPVSLEGIKAAIADRKNFGTDRQLLVNVLTEQYKDLTLSEKQQYNLQQLNNPNCFTITTAHQPNIFTGQLYFIYKILHAVKIAADLNSNFSDAHFVPVYYMGSEDADLDELGHIFINGQKYEWQTNQTGAVGRMKVDDALVKLITTISGQLLVHPFGKEIVDLMQQCYKPGVTIEQATFLLVNQLFAEYGLLIFLPDSHLLKQAFIPVIQRELEHQFSQHAVHETVSSFPAKYKQQASGRELNMLYLQEGSRERIEKVNDEWLVVNTTVKFNRDEILQELQQYPERFSPNVILRPVLQETILPNIIFIGGGGEIAYWLELKKVFAAAGVPYPLMVVRNSFLIIEKKYEALIKKLQVSYEQIFKKEFDLMTALVKRDSSTRLDLDKEKEMMQQLYQQVKKVAANVDSNLQNHTEALYTKALKKINALEKKILKAEKLKFASQQTQLHKIKSQLFPNNSLQERTENLMLFYALWGSNFIKTLYDHSLTLEQEFCVLVED